MKRTRGRPMAGDEPRKSMCGAVVTKTELARIDKARGKQTRSSWLREAALAKLESAPSTDSSTA